MIKKSLEEALHNMDPEIVDAVAEKRCESRLNGETGKIKTINFKKRIVLIAAAAALAIAAVLIPLGVMMSRKPEPVTPIVTDSGESESEKQTEPTSVQPGTPSGSDTPAWETEILPVTTEPTENGSTVKPEVRFKEFIQDFPYYENVGELIESASNIYEGKVVGVSFEVLNVKTGLKIENGNDPDALLYTIYEVASSVTYKGEAIETHKIKVIGGIRGAYENEQIQALQGAGVFDGTIPVCAEMSALAQDEVYLFFTVSGNTEYELTVNGEQYAIGKNSDLFEKIKLELFK